MYINTARNTTPLKNFWNNIHFHPTDAIEDEWGQKILNDVAADNAAHTVRMYAMLEDIVTRDENGQLQYDFTENDIRMDYMVSKGFNLLLSYNFIPACMARNASLQSNMAKNKTRYKGKMIITSPPTDYAEWEEVCYRYTCHILERYGEDTVKSWYLQCLNEPDIRQFWMGDLDTSMESVMTRLQEYCKLYDGFEAGILRASQNLKLGGPGLANNAMFLAGLLQHVKETDRRMDYVCVHSYGTSPKLLNENAKPFCVDNNIQRIRLYREIIDHIFPQGKEYVVDEWGASTAGFFNIEECPKLIFRETVGFAAYFGKLVSRLIIQKEAPDALIICLSGQHEMVVDFSGFRNLFTMNHIKKPIYNAYVLMSKLGDELIDVTEEDNTAILTTKKGDTLSILLSHAAEYFNQQLPEKKQALTLHGLQGTHNVTVYRIDSDHCDPYGEYLRRGMTDPLTEEQIAHLRKVGTLEAAEVFTANANADGDLELEIPLNGDSLVLVKVV